MVFQQMIQYNNDTSRGTAGDPPLCMSSMSSDTHPCSPHSTMGKPCACTLQRLHCSKTAITGPLPAPSSKLLCLPSHTVCNLCITHSPWISNVREVAGVQMLLIFSKKDGWSQCLNGQLCWCSHFFPLPTDSMKNKPKKTRMNQPHQQPLSVFLTPALIHAAVLLSPNH